MNSVTDIIKIIDQPYGGLLPISKFVESRVDDSYGTLICSMQPLYVGKTIDSALHLLVGKEPEKVLADALKGYNTRVEALANKYRNPAESESQLELYIQQEDIKKHVDVAHMLSVIREAVEKTDVVTVLNETYGIIQYEEWNTRLSTKYNFASINDTIKTVPKGDMKKLYIMLYRTLKWLQRYDYRVQDFKFYPDGYTDTVQYGVGDFICNNIMFDVKCTKNKPTSQNTVQILVYYCMGLRSNNKLYKHIKQIGLYSPITNTEWIMDVKDIPVESIQYINDIIGEKSL